MNWHDKERLEEIRDLVMDAGAQLRDFKDDNNALDLESAHLEIESALADVQDFLRNSYWGPEEVRS